MMNIFGPTEARHYCGSFGSTPGMANGSLRDYVAITLKGTTTLVEGTQGFAAYRDCSLRDVERFMFLAVSQYRRFADLMLGSSASWAYVTLYYGSYYAANALLGMFGGWVNNRTVIDVEVNAPGQQALRISRGVKTIYQGSHRAFWECFYDAVAPLYPWADRTLGFALQPVSGSVTWQIDNRNLINYDSFAAHEFMAQFHAGFRRSKFPAALPGVLNTQYQVFEALMLLTCSFMRQFGLVTDALAGFPSGGNRRAKIRALVFEAETPNLGVRLRRRGVLV